eukprot:GHVQ01024161.1.p2 GENE.GHVQ01024161.1~~GHVQ01024161.1.p2  ORF type:complete len:166 (-),score=38.21 GHVQ01024161.1:853-1350(-)
MLFPSSLPPTFLSPLFVVLLLFSRSLTSQCVKGSEGEDEHGEGWGSSVSERVGKVGNGGNEGGSVTQECQQHRQQQPLRFDFLCFARRQCPEDVRELQRCVRRRKDGLSRCGGELLNLTECCRSNISRLLVAVSSTGVEGRTGQTLPEHRAVMLKREEGEGGTRD